MAGLVKGLTLLLAVAMPLAGSTVGFAQWQRERVKAGAEFQHMRTEEQERANYAACVDHGAMPGSPQNLECQMEMTKKERGAGKAQNPPDKSSR